MLEWQAGGMAPKALRTSLRRWVLAQSSPWELAQASELQAFRSEFLSNF
jgi:hypothetical protein